MIDSPLCICQGVEDTCHFLFNCERFYNFGQELFNKIIPISQPTLNIHLFSSIQLTDFENRQMFIAVQEFLLKSIQFDVA